MLPRGVTPAMHLVDPSMHQGASAEHIGVPGVGSAGLAGDCHDVQLLPVGSATPSITHGHAEDLLTGMGRRWTGVRGVEVDSTEAIVPEENVSEVERAPREPDGHFGGGEGCRGCRPILHSRRSKIPFRFCFHPSLHATLWLSVLALAFVHAAQGCYCGNTEYQLEDSCESGVESPKETKNRSNPWRDSEIPNQAPHDGTMVAPPRRFPAVVPLVRMNGERLGLATFVDQQHVLTAADNVVGIGSDSLSVAVRVQGGTGGDGSMENQALYIPIEKIIYPLGEDVEAEGGMALLRTGAPVHTEAPVIAAVELEIFPDIKMYAFGMEPPPEIDKLIVASMADCLMPEADGRRVTCTLSTSMPPLSGSPVFLADSSSIEKVIDHDAQDMDLLVGIVCTPRTSSAGQRKTIVELTGPWQTWIWDKMGKH
eukprot:evm.model.scf_586.2 EVM.evm.TU.scf_586.2   scf_586:32991-38690(-)